MTLVASLASTFVTGIACGPKKNVVETVDATGATDPKTRFTHGVQLLKSPAKDGSIDYGTAYGDFDFASSGTDKALQTKANFNAGWTAEQLGKLDDAEKHYKAAWDADNSYEKAFFSLARVLEGEGKNDDAVALYKGYVDAHADKLDVRSEYANALALAKKYDEAIAQAQQILMKDPKNAGAYRTLSAMYYAQGNYGMSQICSEKALTLNAGDPGTYNNLGVTFLLENDEASAIDKFKTALKLAPTNYESNMNLGYVALNSGDYKLALDCFTAASKADSASVDAKIGLAVAERGSKQYDKAAALYDEIIKADPQNKLAYFNASTLHEKYTKDYKRALKYLTAWADLNQGKLAPDDEVFKREDRVKESQTIEEARQAAEAAKIKAAKERDERNAKLLADLKASVDELKKKVDTNKACIGDAGDDAAMFLEQAADVFTANDGKGDPSSAPDLKTMLDSTITPEVDAAIAAGCAGAAPAPGGAAPAPGGTPAPDAPPAGGTPAPAPTPATPPK